MYFKSGFKVSLLPAVSSITLLGHKHRRAFEESPVIKESTIHGDEFTNYASWVGLRGASIDLHSPNTIIELFLRSDPTHTYTQHLIGPSTPT